MPKPQKRTYSRYTQEAVDLLADLIRLERLEQKITAQELADRAGVSRGLLQRAEKGDLKCEIGAVFEIATILGIKLFSSDQEDLKINRNHLEDKLELLPKRIRKTAKKVKDDF